MTTTPSTTATGVSDGEELPLAGLRVVEVSTFVAAPLGGMTLAQLGAEVVRVDPLGGAPDHARWPLAPSGTSLYWAGLNKGKKSLQVDLRSDEGRRLVTDLVASSGEDGRIVLTNAVGRRFLTYEALAEQVPGLVHVQVDGHHDGTPAVDYTVNAGVGFPSVTGPQGHADPVNHVLPAWDIACGLYAATSILAADRHRRRTGRGRRMRIALHDVALAMAGNLGFLAEAQVGGVERRRMGNYLYGGFARDFTTRDGGRVMIVALTARHWQDLLRVSELGGPVKALEDGVGADFSTEDDRFAYREVLAGLFAKWIADLDLVDVESRLEGTSLLWSRYRTFTDLVADGGVAIRDNPLIDVVDQPGVGEHFVPASPIALGASRTPVVRAPVLGEHSASVVGEWLGDAGYDPSELQRRGVIA
ncbi:CoA transferase [Actinomycetospora chibensis]|uniref:CoA transferase n=1 Tax=Actinomycetospora chibensis TaxID=663606 RepID=A0ABV9RE82_9PSEU|nr:CoA transferase [Actinomycetospora chibensis]MDD7925108.1 CoA transferase [Actinomycetospora chibensis]